MTHRGREVVYGLIVVDLIVAVSVLFGIPLPWVDGHPNRLAAVSVFLGFLWLSALKLWVDERWYLLAAAVMAGHWWLILAAFPRVAAESGMGAADTWYYERALRGSAIVFFCALGTLLVRSWRAR